MSTRQSHSISLGLAAVPDVDDPALFQAMMPVYNAIRNTMSAVDTYTGNSLVSNDEYATIDPYSHLLVQKGTIFFCKASETITVGHAVNIWDSSGARVRKATSTNLPDAIALASAVAVGDTIPVCLFGLISVLSGLTAGAYYYPTATPGVISTTVLGNKIGKALSSSTLWFNP